MTSLTDAQREFVALGAAIGAGCQPCTQYHVRAALKAGLSPEEIRRAIDEAQAVRQEGGVAVANVGRTMLGLSEEAQGDGRPQSDELPLRVRQRCHVHTSVRSLRVETRSFRSSRGFASRGGIGFAFP